MYNRYIPNGTSYTRIVEQEEPPRHTPPGHPSAPPRQPPPPGGAQPRGDPLSSLLSSLGFAGKKGGGLSGLLDIFKLDGIDTGDILLILILLFLFRDGDDMELVITLALILLLGLGDKEKEPPAPQAAQELFGA